jgi:hypothetical protein
MATAKRYGLRLTLGGAPLTPHTVPGVPGQYRPNVPTPVGQDGELSLDDAKRAVDDHPDVLELVTISEKDVKAAKKLADDTAQAVRRGLADAAQVAEGAEVSVLKDEKAAVAAAKE